jgi:diaminopimelate decarboxylase
MVSDPSAISHGYVTTKHNSSIAMKCNPDPELIKQLIDLDVGIDCASPNELECAVDLGALPERIVYTNPIKTPSSLETAQMLGVKTFVFDNVEELLKIKKWTPNAELLLRIEADDPSATINFGSKFGVSPDSAGALVELASKLGMEVAGICFHIGEQSWKVHITADHDLLTIVIAQAPEPKILKHSAVQSTAL